MASFLPSSVAPCKHLTSVLAPMTNPSSNLPSRAVVIASSHLNRGASSGSSGGGSRWSSKHPDGCRSSCTISNDGQRQRDRDRAEFYRGKNILVIGGTGFLAKVFIKKILRTNPDIGKIYVMVKAKDTEAALKVAK